MTRVVKMGKASIRLAFACEQDLKCSRSGCCEPTEFVAKRPRGMFFLTGQPGQESVQTLRLCERHARMFCRQHAKDTAFASVRLECQKNAEEAAS
jgi:hypothetical protein